MCTVNGNIDAGSNGIYAKHNSVVTVDGNVSGGDGDQGEVDFENPSDYSDGGDGIWAEDEAIVTVTGDVKGGNAYGTYGYAGEAVLALDASEVTVGGNAIGGNVVANPATEGATSVAGHGVAMVSTATVKIGGNAIGGSTNGNQGCGGCGVYLNIESGETGALTVGGQVKSGTGGEDGVSPTDLSVYDYEDGKLPAITMGACGSVGGYNDNPSGELTQDQLDAILAQIKITGLGKPEGVLVQYDLFWIQVVGQIRDAEPGSELTVDAGNRTSIPVYVLNAAAQRDITLIIKWNGGADIVVKNAVEVTGKTILLSELAKLVK